MPAIDLTGASPSLHAAGTPALAPTADAGAFSAGPTPVDGQAARAFGRTTAAAPPGSNATPLDDTAESVPDTVATLSQAFARRAEVLLLAQQSQQQLMQAQIDRRKDEFNASQEERTEQLREMNALRDMALAQAKQDDEVLKKYIAMI